MSKVRTLWCARQHKGSTVVHAAVRNILRVSAVCFQGDVRFADCVISLLILRLHSLHSTDYRCYKDACVVHLMLFLMPEMTRVGYGVNQTQLCQVYLLKP